MTIKTTAIKRAAAQKRNAATRRKTARDTVTSCLKKALARGLSATATRAKYAHELISIPQRTLRLYVELRDDGKPIPRIRRMEDAAIVKRAVRKLVEKPRAVVSQKRGSKGNPNAFTHVALTKVLPELPLTLGRSAKWVRNVVQEIPPNQRKRRNVIPRKK